MFTRISLTAAIMIAGVAASAQDTHAAKVSALYDAMAMPAMLEVMREEGLSYGAQIGADMFPARVNADWTATVAAIYDLEVMGPKVEFAFSAALEGADLDPMLTFFTTEPGRTFVQLEVSARRALLDDVVEQASKDTAALAMAEETERYLMVKSFVEANDLIETNVVGAMNANYAFYMGLLAGGAFPGDLTQEQILTDVWSQEADIRQSTTEWVYSFLMMAYQPASDDDLAAYVAFSQSKAGQDLNTALFDGFDDMFEDVSRALGLASSQFMIGADL